MASVLFIVVNPASLTTNETAFRDRLATTLGHAVTLRDAAASDADAGSFGLVVISPNIDHTTLGTKYKTAATGLISTRAATWVNLGLSTVGTTSISNEYNVVVTTADHPVRGTVPSGTQVIFASSTGSGLPFVGSSGTLIARHTSLSTRRTHIVFETGETMADSSTAAGRRVGFSHPNEAALELNATGWQLFDNAVNWSANVSAGTHTTLSLSAGLSFTGAESRSVSRATPSAPGVTPVTTVTLGGLNISAEVGAPLGGTSISWGRGANFDGSSETAGTAVVVVRNDGKKFNPDNGSSPYASALRINQPLRISSVYGSTTRYHFHGFVTRIVPRDDKFAEIHASDPLWRFSRQEVSVPASVKRQLQGFRVAVLEQMGLTTGEWALAADNGPESMIPYTGADQVTGLGVLEELNSATGSFHFIRPTATSFQYVARDRLYLQTNASVETYDPTDYTKPFPVIANADETAETIINEQRVQATPRLMDDAPSTLWELRGSIGVAAGTTRTIWARWSDPAFEVTMPAADRVWETAGTAPTFTFTPFARSAKIEITAGTETTGVKALKVIGTNAPAADIASIADSSASSISTYGLFRGGEVASDYLSSRANARGLASWYVRRYRIPRAKPTMQVVNRFPSQLDRDIGERVTLVYPDYNWGGAGKQFLIRGFRTSVSGSGSVWTTDYDLEHAPDLENLFTIGGTADQGVGGTAILGY